MTIDFRLLAVPSKVEHKPKSSSLSVRAIDYRMVSAGLTCNCR